MALNIFHKGKCVFHITLDWLGKSFVNHQDTLWLSTGRVERLVLPVASVGGIKLLPTGSKCDRWFVQSPSKILFFIEATLKTTFIEELFSFFCSNYTWTTSILNFSVLNRHPGHLTQLKPLEEKKKKRIKSVCRRVTLYFISFFVFISQVFRKLCFFVFCFFIVLSKRGCDKALTNTVSFFRLIKTSASLLSLIAPLRDPWVASTSTLRLKWMFTSPNDYLSQCWVNASALFAAKVTHTHTETRPQTSALGEP